MNNKKVFVVADLHLGVPTHQESIQREKIFIKWLEEIQSQAMELIILGDLFDFWFEYNHVVPKGFVRTLGKLASLSDSGLKISLFSGNHDLWLKNYFPEELNIPVFHQPVTREIFGKKYFIAHGDGLGPGDYGFKIMKKGFQNSFLQFCFKWLHPDIGVGIANYFSRSSRKVNAIKDDQDYGDNERLLQFTKSFIEKDYSYDYFIFGHRHKPTWKEINEKNKLIVLGDWIAQFSYLEIGADAVSLQKFQF